MAGFDPGQRNETVRVQGLRELREALRDYPRAARTQLNRELRETVRPIAVEAARMAPKGKAPHDPHPGLLASKIRPTTVRGKPGIRVGVPYAAVHEWGGTIAPRGVAISIERSRFLGRAIHDEMPDFARRLQVALDRVALELGWH